MVKEDKRFMCDGTYIIDVALIKGSMLCWDLKANFRVNLTTTSETIVDWKSVNDLGCFLLTMLGKFTYPEG